MEAERPASPPKGQIGAKSDGHRRVTAGIRYRVRPFDFLANVGGPSASTPHRSCPPPPPALMRAAIDSVGVDGVELRTTACQGRGGLPAHVTTQPPRAHRHNIYTAALFSTCASKPATGNVEEGEGPDGVCGRGQGRGQMMRCGRGQRRAWGFLNANVRNVKVWASKAVLNEIKCCL